MLPWTLVSPCSRQRVADSRVACCSWCSSPLLFFCYCVGVAGRPVRPGAESRAPGEERTPPCAAIPAKDRPLTDPGDHDRRRVTPALRRGVESP